MGDVRLPDDDLARLKALTYTVLTARIGRVEIDAFIAATHPATILALIEELQAARARITELERLALKAFTVVEWVCGEGKLLEPPHFDADDLLMEMVPGLGVEDSADARARVQL